MVFLAYTTTPAVARRLGAGDERGAVAAGIDGLWLALGLGVVLAVAGWFAAPLLVGAFGAAPAVTREAVTYLTISMLGLPAMLLVFAATGLLRGLQDTRTPLVVAGIGFAREHRAQLRCSSTGSASGIAGSAHRHRRRPVGHGRGLPRGRGRAGTRGVRARRCCRTGPGCSAARHPAAGCSCARVSLRAAMLLAVFVATRLGSPELAAFQIAMTLFATLAFALDALAIAAQALVGKALGAGDVARVRAVLAPLPAVGRRCAASCSGLVVVATSGVLGWLFTSAPDVVALLPPRWSCSGSRCRSAATCSCSTAC